mmetsp:Transcript_18172/g.39614  ORF Transcript_18172/g.39614 Transcript_18172/m.39614 type:complete len:234 (-) Transcript_18172:1808-2509(-)
MIYGKRLLFAIVLFRGCSARSLSNASSSLSLSTFGSSVLFLMAILNPPVISREYEYGHLLSDNRLRRSGERWYGRDNMPAVVRTLLQLSNDINTDNKVSIITSSPSIAGGKPSTGANYDRVNNDKLDDSTNDDIVLAVPLNFARGENMDDAMFEEAEEEESSPSSLSSKALSAGENDGGIVTANSTIDHNRNNTTLWIGVIAVAISAIGGFLFYRSRERSRWMKYRMHQILRA